VHKNTVLCFGCTVKQKDPEQIDRKLSYFNCLSRSGDYKLATEPGITNGSFQKAAEVDNSIAENKIRFMQFLL
jgi:hypothetical protein